MRVEGDHLVPVLPTVNGLSEQLYDIQQSRKNPNRVYLGHGDGLGSMRWDGHTWIDEGRLPNVIYEARGLEEDGDGILWAGGGDGKILRVEVAPTGMRDSKVEVLTQKDGLPDGTPFVNYVAGSVMINVDPSRTCIAGIRQRTGLWWTTGSSCPSMLPTPAPTFFGRSHAKG